LGKGHVDQGYIGYRRSVIAHADYRTGIVAGFSRPPYISYPGIGCQIGFGRIPRTAKKKGHYFIEPILRDNGGYGHKIRSLRIYNLHSARVVNHIHLLQLRTDFFDHTAQVFGLIHRCDGHSNGIVGNARFGSPE
jgi:hypothetical protein